MAINHLAPCPYAGSQLMDKAQYMPLLDAVVALTTRVPEGMLQLTVLKNRIEEAYPKRLYRKHKIDQKRGLLNAVLQQALRLPINQQVKCHPRSFPGLFFAGGLDILYHRSPAPGGPCLCRLLPARAFLNTFLFWNLALFLALSRSISKTVCKICDNICRKKTVCGDHYRKATQLGMSKRAFVEGVRLGC